MPKNSPLAWDQEPLVGAVRRHRDCFDRDDRWQRPASFHNLSTRAWPLFAGMMGTGVLPARVQLDTPSKRVLYRLAHPAPIYTAKLDAAIEREKQGLLLSSEERTRLEAALQEKADKDAAIFDPGHEDTPTGVTRETRSYQAGLMPGRRFNLLRSYFEDTGSLVHLVRRPKQRKPILGRVQALVEADRLRWTANRLLGPLRDLDALRQRLCSFTPDQVVDGFRKFGAEKCEKQSRNKSHSERARMLATCIASAKLSWLGQETYVADPSLREKVDELFSHYSDALKAASRRSTPKILNKSLLLKSFKKRI